VHLRTFEHETAVRNVSSAPAGRTTPAIAQRSPFQRSMSPKMGPVGAE